MNKNRASSIKYIFFSSILFFAFSCSNDKEDLLSLNQEIDSAEVKTIFEIDELSSAADDVVTQIFQDGLAGKRASKPNDCYKVNFSNTGYTVIFANCELEGVDNIVNGSLVVTYINDDEASVFTAVYTSFMVGDIEINGTRTFTVNNNTNLISFTIISDMSIELENGFLVQESGSKTLSVVFDTQNITNNGLTIETEGDWTVKVDENTYLIKVTSALQTNFNCSYIAEGTIDFNKNGLQASIDFGDGICDDVAELIYPDKTREEISLKD